jgi:MFS family permease
MPRSTVFNGILLAAVIEIFTLPGFGYLSDRYGRKPLFIAGCLFSILFAFPMFWLFDTRNPLIIAITIAVAVSLGHTRVWQRAHLQQMLVAGPFTRSACLKRMFLCQDRADYKGRSTVPCCQTAS